MSNETIPDGVLKPSMSLICPYCQKSHKIAKDSDGKILECAQCKQRVKIPNDSTVRTNQLGHLSQFDEISKQLNDLQKLVIEQENEIKILKTGGLYEGLLPKNAQAILGVIMNLKTKLEESLDEVDSLTEINPDESNSSQSSNES